MALSIKSDEADRLAREVARRTGETLTQAVEQSLRERLERISGKRRARTMREDVARMQARIAALGTEQEGSDDELIEYDEQGLPR